MSPSDLELLGDVLRYPQADFATRVTAAHEALSAVDSDLAEHIIPLVHAVHMTPLTDLEELFTRTFDLNPVCALEVGWHLWGEDYNRGVFLAKARGILREAGVKESGELPDHLCHLLPALARLEDDDRAEELAREFILPAIDKMLDGFKEDGNPWRGAVLAIRDLLIRRYGEPVAKVSAVPPGESRPYDFRNTPFPTGNEGGN